ncbi:immunity 49 family protein [Thermomonospora umbrina]|uniref:Immunity protein 49 of polymorphic toxin system n=1 Tax=Thermomonospora umbrina TaxID=111806 RepID=A0A3D9SX67_9ACTN|nr:immunity 49 family protein [Thermomonospora umbrina]REE97164.1 immunity protein 49 of polymorphic toxin system [Thermomonospora umbrina]
MRTVPRHEIDLAMAKDGADWFHKRNFEAIIPRLKAEPSGLDSLLYQAGLELNYRCVADPTARFVQTWESATLATQAGSALYATGLRTEGTVECLIHDDRLDLPAVGPQWWMDLERWRKAVFYAMTCRDRERTDLLCSVTPQFMQSATGAAPLPWAFPFIEAVRGWWRREEGYFDHLLEAARLADPEDPTLDDESREHVALNVFPQIRVFGAVVAGQAAEFNDALFEALELHRTFWTRDTRRAEDPLGYVALPLLAFTCLAKETGIPIEVRSEYLPQNLVDGSWVGSYTF